MSIGIDISSWQKDIDLKTALKSVDFAIIKATQGRSYINPYFSPWAAEVIESGKILGLYHFLGSINTDPIAEANWFIEITNYLKGNFFAVLDVEVAGDSPLLGNWVYNWCKHVSSQLNCAPIIYTNPNFLAKNNGLSDACNGSNLWLAQWGADNGKMNKMPERPFVIWQYTSKGKVDGCPVDVDINYCPPDVNLRDYYSSEAKSFNKAESFLIDNGIFEGYGDGEYGFDDIMTREQFAWALYRYHQKFK